MAEKYTHFDTVVVGAGISGIDAAYRLQEQAPDQTYTLLEARDHIGGTWDLFKYPGIRSDSDLHTFGFPFRPWEKENPIAEGASIVEYLNDTVNEFGIDKHIQFRHRLEKANWSSDEQQWFLTIDAEGQKKHISCHFLAMCTGYYDYKSALPSLIPGIDNFQGQVIHPQFWPEDLDYTGKKITIVGSGATAITLLPVVAQKASEAIMLQRSPTYIIAKPQTDALDNFIRGLLPWTWASTIIRYKNFLLPELFYRFCIRFPTAAKRLLQKGAASLLPEGYPLKPNFEPKYNPWDQRMCVAPKGDFYTAIRENKAEVITAHIDTVTKDSIIIKDSDRVLHPDIIVTATGLRLLIAGGAQISVDNEPVDIASKHLYRGMMLQDVPNLAIFIGYTNASWTLGSDATAQFVTRLIKHMQNKGITSAVPTVDPSKPMKETNILNLNSTYITSAQSVLPKGGDVGPWRPRTMWIKDKWDAQHGAFTDIKFNKVST